MTTGEKIKELRKKKGLTQEELGRMIGVQKAAINKYETGVVVNLKRDIISSLAKALDVSPLVLLDDDETDQAWEEYIQSILAAGGRLSTDEILLVRDYRALPSPGKQYIHQQLRAAQLMFGEKSADIPDSNVK